MTIKSNSNARDQKLTQTIVELIAIYQGTRLSHNKLIEKLSEEGISAKKTIEDKLKELQSIDVIERQGDGNKKFYYIHGTAKTKITYDKQLSSKLEKIRKILDEIEKNSVDTNQDGREYYYACLDHVEEEILRIPPQIKDPHPIDPEQEFDGEIEPFSKYDNDKIFSQIKNAKNIKKNIRTYTRTKRNAAQKIMKTKNDEEKGELCATIVKSAIDIKNSLNEMLKLLSTLRNLKEIHQRKIFREVFRSCVDKSIKYTKNHDILQELQNIYNVTPDENMKRRLSKVINDFYRKTQKPVKKNMLMKELVKTKQFTKEEAKSRLDDIHDEPWIFAHGDDFYPRLYSPLSNPDS